VATRDRKWKRQRSAAHASAAAIERRNEVMRWLPTVGRSRRRPQPQSLHRRVRRTRIGYSVRMAWIGSTDAARWAGVKLATITTTASSAQAMTIVVGSNVETP
jgi:hypothetical protein